MPREPESIQVLDRAFRVLEALAAAPRGLPVRDIAEQTSLSISTTHRILATLSDNGYVSKNPETGHYEIGYGLIEMVSRRINSLELFTEARPYLGTLSQSLSLTAHLGVLRGGNVLYVERLDMLPTVQLFSQVGLQVPAYCSSLGKCLLSGLPSSEVDRALANSAFVHHTPNTITDIDALKAHLKEVRARGWAMDDEEQELGFRCVGAPIVDYRGEIIAAVSASGSTEVLTEERIPRIAEDVKAAARGISRRLGGDPV